MTDFFYMALMALSIIFAIILILLTYLAHPWTSAKKVKKILGSQKSWVIENKKVPLSFRSLQRIKEQNKKNRRRNSEFRWIVSNIQKSGILEKSKKINLNKDNFYLYYIKTHYLR